MLDSLNLAVIFKDSERERDTITAAKNDNML